MILDFKELVADSVFSIAVPFVQISTCVGVHLGISRSTYRFTQTSLRLSGRLTDIASRFFGEVHANVFRRHADFWM